MSGQRINLSDDERMRRAERARARNWKHGHKVNGHYAPEYTAWANAKARCTNPKSQAWRNYGGRGIQMCTRWLDSYEAFLEDMGVRPSNHELDRVNNDGNYEPGNCRWVERKVNARNRRTNKMVSLGGRTMTAADLADQTGLPYALVKGRVRAGWTGDRIAEVPDTGSGLKEGPILMAVRAALLATGKLMLWRNQVGAYKVRDRLVTYGLGVGSADLVGCLRGSGRLIAFEVKSGAGRQTHEQRLWGDAVRAAGGFYAVVRSVEEALAALERAKCGEAA